MIVKINGRERSRDRPKVGLALSGGGIRGITHIGILKALSEQRIPIDLIAGTSAGSIVAAMYSTGYSIQQMRTLAETIKLSDLIDLKISMADLLKFGMKWMFSSKNRFWSAVPAGLIKGNKLEEYFVKLWHDRTVKDTKIPIAITAVDINTADTIFFCTPIAGHRKILNALYNHNATLAEAVRASISIPGIFYPKKYRNMTLVDGAVKNNLPTDILRHMGADVIIGVDLGYAGQPNYGVHSIEEILLQCLDIMGREVTLLKGEENADLVVRPEIFDINMKDPKQMQLFIARGEDVIHQNLSAIRSLLQK